MLFCSIQYVLFLAAVFALYWSLPSPRARTWLLLAASFYFYASWSKWLALLIGGSALMDYLIARGMEKTDVAWHKKLLLRFSLVMNLGILVVFKYANFFLDSLHDLLHHVGASATLPVLQFILPIGISFYTFEAINYTVDVYRGRIRAERNLSHFLLFILFFPHLVAGPIVRAKDFLPQIKRPKRWNWPRLCLGLWLLVLGTIKKLAIADRMALYVGPVFANPGDYSGATIGLAAVAFALQVYCDFSGYSDMAIGSAHLLGYKLAVNFRLPFLAVNIADFWKRWHISLSTWLRDYLFIPLGGNRGSRWLVYRNLMIVMTLGGLWHGAAWNFVLWGASMGLLLVSHKAFADWGQTRWSLQALLRSAPGTALRIGLTFMSFVLTLMIFRATSVPNIGVMFQRLFGWAGGAELPLPALGLWWTFLAVALGHALGSALARNQLRTWRFVQRVPPPALGFGTAALLNLALLLAPATSKAFIYFQF
jgi:alginate O-acetyltransferase complex protein AlgI